MMLQFSIWSVRLSYVTESGIWSVPTHDVYSRAVPTNDLYDSFNLVHLDAVYHSAICFVTKAPYTTHHCNLYALVGWSSLHIRCQTHWLQIIYKSLLGKPPPYLSSLVTIATPTRSTHSSRYISLVIPKANTSFGRLSFLCCQWLEQIAKIT